MGETAPAAGSPQLVVTVDGFVNSETADTAAGYTAPGIGSITQIDTNSYTLTPGGGSGGGSPTYRPDGAQPEGGEITVSPQNPHRGDTVTVTDNNGNEVGVTDNGDGTFSFTQPSGKVTIEVTFREIAPAPLLFTDVAEGAWYESAVRYAYTHGIVEGMSETAFSPNTSLTRAQAVQVLYNMEGEPTVSGTAAFSDLVYDWYKPAISWAESTGVVDGYEDSTFRPDEPVTREEFSQMLYNYAAYKGYDLTATGDLTQFPDGDSVQEWAIPAMAWANGNELINGHDDGTLEPGGTTTRAQAASIPMRFDQNVVGECIFLQRLEEIPAFRLPGNKGRATNSITKTNRKFYESKQE